MQGLIGKKLGMTSIFDENGRSIACTVVQAGPCVVTQVKNQEKDGYSAIQIAWGDMKPKHASKAITGHCAKANTAPKRVYHEFRNPEGAEAAATTGEVYDVNIFTSGDFVDVIGTSKGKGFQGVVKRHGFAGVGESTHGQHNRARHPGSIGACSFPSRVFKGLRMAGRTGGKRVKGLNLEIVRVIPEQNVVLLRGSIPGYNGSTVIIER